MIRIGLPTFVTKNWNSLKYVSTYFAESIIKPTSSNLRKIKAEATTAFKKKAVNQKHIWTVRKEEEKNKYEGAYREGK